MMILKISLKHALFCVIGFAMIGLTPSCNSKQQQSDERKQVGENEQQEEKVLAPADRPLAKKQGKFFEKDGRKFLWGGENDDQHFDITDYSLIDEQFHYGIGREKFPALLSPQFISLEEADKVFNDNDRFLTLNMDGVVKAYSIEDLTKHEVVNDEINGKPVMAAYCILADLGAVYDRTIGGKPFTFALSGYTYFDPKVWDGMDGFVLWDRETESLWWPLIGKAVSGKMKGRQMKVLPEEYWSQTIWKTVKTNHPSALVLAPGQDFERPKEWIKYDTVEPDANTSNSIAPKWGENTNG